MSPKKFLEPFVFTFFTLKYLMPLNNGPSAISIPIKLSEPLPGEIENFMTDAHILFRDPLFEDRFILEFIDGQIQLRHKGAPKENTLCIDFFKGASWHRFRFAQGREAIARAVGIKKGARPSIVDATAGLGRDAFVLASLGCRVHMLERSPMVAALLFDGLRRAFLNPEGGEWVKQRLSLSFQDSCEGMASLPFDPQVIYLDPMFPERTKSALVKKDMRILQQLLGHDTDADCLFETAVRTARERVVVKRPIHADPLAGRKPDAKIISGKNRFDIYHSDRHNKI